MVKLNEENPGSPEQHSFMLNCFMEDAWGALQICASADIQ